MSANAGWPQHAPALRASVLSPSVDALNKARG